MQEKKITMRAGRGRPCKLLPQEIATIYVWFMKSKMRSFKVFYEGVEGEFLRPFFPKMPSYTAFLKQLKNCSKEFCILARERDGGTENNKVYIDSTPPPVCEDVHSKAHRVFAGMAQWAYSSTGKRFGIKLHLIVNKKRKIQNFILKPGSMHDVSCAEEVLKNFRGTVIGDKGYCSAPLARLLKRKKVRLVARHKKNMTPNTLEEKKLLQKRSLVETVIGKFKNFFGTKLSRFRSPQAAFSAICAGILAVNLGS
jgi:IS5 family transposase